jgi:hypothetical protein
LHDAEFELLDTGVFDESRYFDIFVEYAKGGPEDILMRVTAVNRGPEAAELHLLPTLWLRNTWSWGYEAGPMGDVPVRPTLAAAAPGEVRITHPALGEMWLHVEQAQDLLFTENETNFERLFETPNRSPYVKDGIGRAVVDGEAGAVHPGREGTKVAAHHAVRLESGASAVVRLRLSQAWVSRPFDNFDAILARRQGEADAFYATVQRPDLSEDARDVQRQALAGMLWTKQLYYYDVEQWLRGDPAAPAPSESRREGRNRDWQHLNNFDVISMPDAWEYPWYAAWDLAFHCLPLAMVDPDYARRQLELMTREWYMHPNGQLPAYEWALGDVNPPVHAWAAWQVYRMDVRARNEGGRAFLEGIFHKLLLNFTWWVNRKDDDGNNVFQGGFLGLDNISLFDRSAELPTGGHIDQADGTAWMGFYTLGMLRIALELARDNAVYQQLATKFFEHFLAIANAIGAGFDGQGLWDEEDGFYYDVLHLPDGSQRPLRVRSLVGLMPLLAVTTLHHDTFAGLPIFSRRMRWFLEHRPHLAGHMLCAEEPGADERHILSIVTPERLRAVLTYMLDEQEFLSPYGIRSLSKAHREPYHLDVGGQTFSIQYEPAESRSQLFGGNSNWRGPVWLPINYLLIEALHEYHRYFGETFTIECPTGSGVWMSLDQVADELSRRVISIFQRDAHGDRPVFGGARMHQDDPHWRDYPLFYEYFHGDDGAGLGASHQTGWTGLVANLIQQVGG